MSENIGIDAVQRWGGYEGQRMAFHQKENGECFTYVTISAGGPKPEGRPMESRPTAALAAEALFEQIDTYLGDASPIWRELPRTNQDGDQFYATARLVREETR